MSTANFMESLESVSTVSNFSERDSTTDVCFVVDDHPIFFSKALLALSSRVFAQMFAYDHDKVEDEISLSDMNYTEFLSFLMQLHPAYAWLPISVTDLEPLLKLADEYDTIHVKRKCTHFIHTQMQTSLSRDEVLRYLWLSEVYQLTEVQDSLMVLAAEHALDELEACKHYYLLQRGTREHILKVRCKELEDEKDDKKRSLLETGRALRKLKSVVDRLPGLVHTLPDKCYNPCFDCPNKISPCFRNGTTYWCYCDYRQKHVSYLQMSYCKSCVMRKAGLIVSKLASLFQPIKSVQTFLSSNWIKDEFNSIVSF